jgi:hypothetical protein
MNMFFIFASKKVEKKEGKKEKEKGEMIIFYSILPL